MRNVFALANQKGGVAKTTTAINLSACLAELGKKVLLIDMDPQGNATSGLGVDRQELEHCIYDVLIAGAPLEAVILPSQIPGLSLAPATINLAGAEVELVAELERESRLKQALQPVKDRYDYVIVDCPPSLGLLTLNALSAADGILSPVQCEYYALEGLGQLLNTFQAVKKNLNPELEIAGVLMTMFDSRTNLSIQVVDEVKAYFGNQVFASLIPRNIRLAEAPSHGLAIRQYDQRSRGSEAYAKLTQEFLDRQQQKEA